MIIELVGLPGAGKTTYARSLGNLERYTRVRIESRLELIWYNFLFLLRFPITSFRLFTWLVLYRGPRTLWYTKFTSIFLDYNAKYMKARRFPYALLDQGHLQVFLSLFETQLPERLLHKLLNFLPKADHYVWFDIPEAVRQRQLGKRGYASREGLMDDELREQWQVTAAEHFVWLKANNGLLAPATVDTVTDVTKVSEVVELYKTTKFMRYVTFARMPTEKAHGLQIATMCTEFQKAGHFVSLITPRRKNPITETVTAYYQLAIPLQHHQVRIPDIIGMASKVRQAHHYFHELLFALTVLFNPVPRETLVYTRTALVAKIATWRGRTVLAEMHFWPNRGRRLMAWLLKGKSVKLVANSEGTRDAMAGYGLTALVAHNGFPEEWLTIDIDKKSAQERLGIKTDLPVAMYVGSLGKWKGVDTLCEASEALKDKVQVVVIGGSSKEVKDWKTRYPHVMFIGTRPYADLGWEQKAADVLVVPNDPRSIESEQYTSPIKLFAHLASGKPVVVSDLPALRAIVDEQSVWFFKAGGREALAKTILQVLPASDLKKQKIANATALANQHTWFARAQRILSNIS